VATVFKRVQPPRARYSYLDLQQSKKVVCNTKWIRGLRCRAR
jgi:hypothetical protein